MTSEYLLPAEWAAQSAIMLTWPHRETDWAEYLAEVDRVYLDICQQVTRFQPLLIVCKNSHHQRVIRQKLTEAGVASHRLLFAIAPSNDSWARDHAPLSCIGDKGARLLDFQFNGWGGKYPAELDNRINQCLFQSGVFTATDYQTVPLVLEGGAVETDGEGTLLATRSSVLTQSRNPDLSPQQVESILTRQLGFKRFLWLEHGHLSGDDTDGHIDTLVRFADPATLLYATATVEDGDYPELEAMAAELRAFRRQDGSPYRLIPLPAIPPIVSDDGERLPAGYANFLIINGAVLLPVYGIEQDSAAIRCLQASFPGREIIPINCLPLIRQNGSLHCITMQFPAQVQFSRAESVQP
ncbi:agmatine deiminase family protein [Sedimenticola sp.]|uniref:agmatine deiminase family protein n=1 Tax=Sedimenticola sp. TaxID=1940285 RepID=UPI003D0A2BDF